MATVSGTRGNENAAISGNRDLPANLHISRVEPRGFEPLTSAVQRRFEALAVVRRHSDKRLSQPNSRTLSSQMFAAVRVGCRQTVVNWRTCLPPNVQISPSQDSCFVWILLLHYGLLYRALVHTHETLLPLVQQCDPRRWESLTRINLKQHLSISTMSKYSMTIFSRPVTPAAMPTLTVEDQNTTRWCFDLTKVRNP
jgi:hypothetical protein